MSHADTCVSMKNYKISQNLAGLFGNLHTMFHYENQNFVLGFMLDQTGVFFE